MLAPCPFCCVELLVPELEWHVSHHLEEDELARDIELAHQIAVASPSSSPRDNQLDSAEPSYIFSEQTGQTVTPCYNHSEAHYLESFDQEKIYDLVGLQIKSTFYHIEGGLMSLLKRCLESESKTSRCVISGYIDHYQSVASEDSGWGCGWRNIQMLSSHLLMVRKQARDVLYAGSGFVPDIPSLQRWLEMAWERGFDKTGSNSFNQKIYGSRKWIGTTECATLFRSFGLPTRIVDFDSISYLGGKRISKHVYGPMDKFIHQRKDEDLHVKPSTIGSHDEHPDLCSHLKHSSTVFDCDSPSNNKEKSMGHQILMDWVWNYFTSEVQGSLDKKHVVTSEKTPLYFQHDGHSRTIVGIQKQQGKNGSQDQFSLLILDPGQRTADLERCLKINKGWQQLVKRGVHTLRKPQYQLCYVDAGIANEEELEQLKTIDSICIRL